MLELDTLAKYLKHLGVRPSLNETIDVGRLEPIQFSQVDFEPFRHRVYSIVLYTDVSTEAVPQKPRLFFKIPYQVLVADPAKLTGISGYYVTFDETFPENYRSLTALIAELPFLKLDHATPIELEADATTLLEGTYLNMLDEYQSTQPDRYDLLAVYLQTLLLQIRRQYKRADSSQQGTVELASQHDRSVAGQYQLLLDSFFKDVEMNHPNRTVAYYANKLALHPNHLNMVVKRVTGKTAHELLHQQLIRYAKDLLQQTPFSIKEIAYQLSFKAPSHFVTFFKKYTASTPARFRQQAQMARL